MIKWFFAAIYPKGKKSNSAERVGFSTADVLYLITPDRFANGDPGNDNQPGMREK